ncbi:hypothetical protein EYC80_003190 [Monilinia laxa]|uniref:Uncharacterized protein n=1 Tax=Monilinia laxa TaxID=61186 RepID=A0A5N6KCZ0_MONLA|nr:hypothetical protein EYC80_003190 [Monilinia laxa]
MRVAFDLALVLCTPFTPQLVSSIKLNIKESLFLISFQNHKKYCKSDFNDNEMRIGSKSLQQIHINIVSTFSI